MRQLPHHIKKLNRRVERSAHREEMEEEFQAAFRKPMTEKQKKKQAKEAKKQEKLNRPLYPKTPDEKNELRKHRTPQTRDRQNPPYPADKRHNPPGV